MTKLNDQRALNAILRQDLGTFIAKVFRTVSPGDRYLPNWHINAIVHELLQVHEGHNRRLIVSSRPGRSNRSARLWLTPPGRSGTIQQSVCLRLIFT